MLPTSLSHPRLRAALAVGLAAGCALPLAALAAPQGGAYTGKSKAKVQGYAEDAPHTDRGKVTFRVRGGDVHKLRIKGQEASCGGQTPEVTIKIEKIELSDSGKGKATYQEPIMGPIDVTIAVTSGGRATGTVKYGGLCAGRATFGAKLSD
jgi:hypothetical protein